MDLKLIMENWRDYKVSAQEKVNEQTGEGQAIEPPDWALEVIEILKTSTQRELSKAELQRIKEILIEYGDFLSDPKKSQQMFLFQFGGRKAGKILGYLRDVYRAEIADKKFASDSFNIEDIKENDPELAQAINTLKNSNVRQSNLLFDGAKLHWRIGRRTIFSWDASSGHYEDDVFSSGYGARPTVHRDAKRLAAKVKASILRARRKDGSVGDEKSKLDAAVKALGFGALETVNNPNFEFDKLIDDMRELVSLIDQQVKVTSQFREAMKKRSLKVGDAEQRRKALETDSEFSKEYNKIKKRYISLSRKIRKIVQRYVEFRLMGPDKDVEEYETSAELRRKRQSIKDFGPTPEGKYILETRMQDLTNIGTADVFLGIVKSVGGINDFDEMALNQLNPGKTKFAGSGDSAWGRFRVRISNIRYVKDKNTGKVTSTDKTRNWMRIPAYKGARGGFFIHGGSYRGSSGCIDLGDKMDSFAKFWVVGGVAKVMGPMVKKSYRRSGEGEYWDSASWAGGKIQIPLYVKYAEREKVKLLSKNPVVKNFAKFIFNSFGSAAKKVKKSLKKATGLSDN